MSFPESNPFHGAGAKRKEDWELRAAANAKYKFLRFSFDGRSSEEEEEEEEGVAARPSLTPLRDVQIKEMIAERRKKRSTAHHNGVCLHDIAISVSKQVPSSSFYTPLSAVTTRFTPDSSRQVAPFFATMSTQLGRDYAAPPFSKLHIPQAPTAEHPPSMATGASEGDTIGAQGAAAGPLAIAEVHGVFPSFFSVVHALFRAREDRRLQVPQAIKALDTWQRSKDAIDGCPWRHEIADWTPLLEPALSYLAHAKGSASAPSSSSSSTKGALSFFSKPLVTFSSIVSAWEWTADARRERDRAPEREDDELQEAKLALLTRHFIDSLCGQTEVVPEDNTATSLCPTSAIVRLSSPEELVDFRRQEAERYSNPHKPFTFVMRRGSRDEYYSHAGPFKGATANDSKKKARVHNVLINDRPAHATLVNIVRDAVARLPNGQGTRQDICTLARDSQYFVQITDSQLQGAVSGALDRLHYESDPCVRFDAGHKVWIYLHRDRRQEDFAIVTTPAEIAAEKAAAEEALIDSQLRVLESLHADVKALLESEGLIRNASTQAAQAAQEPPKKKKKKPAVKKPAPAKESEGGAGATSSADGKATAADDGGEGVKEEDEGRLTVVDEPSGEDAVDNSIIVNNNNNNNNESAAVGNDGDDDGGELPHVASGIDPLLEAEVVDDTGVSAASVAAEV